MNLTRCENGHFYDQDKFDSCPHCKGGAGVTDKTESLSGPMANTDFFRGDGGNVTEPLGGDLGGAWNGGAAQETAEGWGNAGDFGGAGAAEVTEAAGKWETAPARPAAPAYDSLSNKPTEPLSGNPWKNKYEGSISPKTVGGDAAVPEHGDEKSNLQWMIDQAKGKGENTMEKSDEKTIGYYGDLDLGGEEQKTGLDPVVGWLVCIRGEDFGTSFVLKSGKNFIGRDPKMDVVLAKDRSVSRQCHAIVIYDPKSRMFLVQPGTSRELFYLNDKVVLGVEAIQNSDVLSIGKTDLMFVPCCGPNFCWEDQIEKINEEAEKKK